MKTVDVDDATITLSSLVREFQDGDEREIVLRVSGRPIAKLVPVTEAPRRQLGVDRGRIAISPDFDAVNPEVAMLFEGP